MKKYLFLFSLIFFFSLSLILIIKLYNTPSAGKDDEFIDSSNLNNYNYWLQPIFYSDVNDYSTLIFASDSLQCDLCMQKEINEWQKWVNIDTNTRGRHVKLILRSERPQRILHELKAMEITYNVVVDSSIQFSKYGIKQLPTVIFTKNGREIIRYVSDINNRELTKLMQQKLDTLLKIEKF